MDLPEEIQTIIKKTETQLNTELAELLGDVVVDVRISYDTGALVLRTNPKPKQKIGLYFEYSVAAHRDVLEEDLVFKKVPVLTDADFSEHNGGPLSDEEWLTNYLSFSDPHGRSSAIYFFYEGEL